MKKCHIYENFPNLDKRGTTIKQKIYENTNTFSNPSHTITRIQFPIQLIVAHTMR
jgi:hypothetical protein